MAENWWDSYKRTDEEENWWESYKRADEPAPSAGGGRGFVNPPRVFEKQPVRSAPPAPVEPTDYGQASTDMMGGSVPARSVMDQPGLAPRTPGYDPMLNQEYVAKVRQDIIGKAAPEDRMGLLTTLSEKRTDVLGRAARQILAEVQVENKRINFDQERRAERALNDLREAGNPSPPRQSGNAPAPLSFSAPPPVPVPDVFPGIGDVMDGRTPQQIAERRMLAQGIRVADDGMRMDEANRVTNLARDRTAGEYLGDLGVRIEQGGIMARQVIANTIDPTSQWASDLAEKMKASQKAISAPEQYRAQQFALTLAEQPNEWAKGAVMLAEFLTNPTIAVEEVVRQGPLMGAMIAATVVGGGAGGLAVRGAAAVSPRVAFADAISGGMVARAGAAAGAAGVARGAAAVAAGGDAAGQVYEELTSKKNERLMQENADVKRLMDEGKTFEDARSEVALTKARLAQSIAATGGVIFGAAGFEGLLAKKIAGQAIGSTAKRAVVVDLATELADELTTLGASNFAIGQVDPSRALTQDFGQTAATTLVTAAPTAGASAYLARQDQSADPFTDYAARASPSTQNPDGTLIAPEQSARRPYDIGPSAPIRSGADGEINFTPQGSITAEAGLAPIVVPMGAGQQTGGVNGGLPDVLGGLAGGSGVAGGGDPLAGLGSPGRDAGLPGRGGANAQGALVGDGGLALPGAGAGQPGPSLAAGRGERATDADLLARAGQASEGAPAKIWAGRAGDGYAQQQDAQQAFPSLQRRYPDLSWSMQQDADGKFYWSGRSTGESNGSVAGAAGQGLAGVPGVGSAGQEADAGAGVVGFGPSRIGQPGQPGGASTVGSASPDGPAFTLNLAPPAPRQTVLKAITSVKSAQGVDIEFEAQSLTDQQKVASAMARLVGKTVTFYTHKAGPAAAVPNGFVLDGNDRDIFLDKSSNDGALFVMMHEGVHALPQPIREKLVETLKGLTKTDMRSDFATRFSYDINNDYQIDNEIAAFMTQAVSKRKDFWQELRTKMGDGDFAEVAKVIISKLDTFIRGANQAYGEDFLKRYATDAVAVRDAVSTAYAQAMKAQGQQAPAGAASALTPPAADQVTPSQRLQQPVVFDFSQTLFKPQTDAERRQNFANRFNNPVTLADGTRLSGFTDPARQTTFHGYDKNGEQLTIRAEFVSPEDIVFSKDSNRTAELVRNGLMKLQETAPASKNITPSNRAADVNPLGMYSELARKIDAGPGQAMPDQWRGYIRGLTTKGVKPDEIEWSGVEDFISLKGGKVSKQEVADYLKQGGVKVEETVLGNAKGFTQEMQERLDELEEMGDRTDEEDAERQRLISAENAASDERGDTNQTKYSEYTLPGGENYREVLLTLPGKPDVVAGRRAEIAAIPGSQMTPALRAEYESILRESDARKPPKYRSDHWDQPNVLAHIRVNDRTDADGKRVLFVEEIQSDWGQEGKKEGFKGKTQEDAKRFFGIRDEDWAKTSEENRESYRLEMLDYNGRDAIPSAPFVTKTEGWLNLALKRVMTMAAEGGYDRVAFVNGEQSHKRFPKKASGESTKESFKAFYDTIVPTALKKLLPKVGGGQMGGVQFDATGEGRFSVFDEDSGEMVWRGETREDAEEFVSTYGGDASIKEGSKDYDKFGGTQPGFDITPAMREKVATTGLPMFSKKVGEQDAPDGNQGAARVGKVDTHILGVERGERAESKVGRLSDEEKTIIFNGAKKATGASAADLEARARDNKRAHPASDGWAPLTLSKVKINDAGKAELIYKTAPYDFNVNDKGKALKTGSKDYKQRVQSMGRLMLDEVRAVYERAQQGDKAAINIIAQSGWYKEMRTRLRQEFGGLGDLFADLLGATSPNTPVRTNWDNSVEALRLATQGKFDELMPKWIDYFDKLEQAETNLRGFFDQTRKSGMSKKAIKQLDEYKRLSAEARQARDFPDNLLPVKSNGKKFGFNGYNVARAMVDLWRVVRNADPDIGRGGTAPKAINFSGNLIGFRARATIDVWAARMLQRLASKLGISGIGLRSPSMAEGGVTGSALESGNNTLQFGFGQDVFSTAVKMIRSDEQMNQDPVLAGINDDDLQALVWFIEKEIWTKNNWTSAAGEGGSFEFEADLAGVADREQVNALRREADSSVASTAEQREQARRDIESTAQKMQNYPGVVEAQATLDRNAELLSEGQLSKEQKSTIKAENAQARERMSKAKDTQGYKKLERELDRARGVLKKPTQEQRSEMRSQAVGEIGKLARTVDRFTVGLSIQKGAEQGMDPAPPSDEDMAGLARRVVAAATTGANADTVIAVKAIATEGRYGAPERALDAEFIVNERFDAAPLAAATFQEAQDADQDSAFVARVLRPDEKFDPLLHRPGIEIYFRDMKQAEEAAKMMAGALSTTVFKATDMGPGVFAIGGYTVIVDGRPTAAAKAGKMGTPVGMRVIYLPEFEARYGLDPQLADASEDNIRDTVKQRAEDLRGLAREILRKFDGVSFAGRFDYEVDTRFAGEYQGAIDGYTSAAPAGGTDSGRGQIWQGRPVGPSIAAAVGRLPLNGGQQGATVPDRVNPEIRFSRRVNDDRGRRAAGRGAADRALQASERAASEETLTPLPGAPKVPGYHGPDPRIVAVAEQYARDNGIPLRRQAEYVAVDPVRAERIADAYAGMRHAPDNPRVKAAYKNLVRQTRAQYDALVAAGYKFWFMDTDRQDNKQYASSPWNQMRDLRQTQSMGVYPTESGFGTGDSAPEDNVMLADTGLRWPYGSPDGELKPVLANDLFRAVHDAFGHGMEGAGFRDQGEENAWQAHVRLYTGSAVGAITSETRGQNSWLNYGPHGENNRTAKVEDTVFSDQKTGLMPEWTWTEGKAGDAPIASNRAAQPKPATPATIIVGGRTLRIPDPAGAVETLDAKINRYSELLKCLQ